VAGRPGAPAAPLAQRPPPRALPGRRLGANARRPRPGGRLRPRRIEALTSDAWYTLIYVAPAEHRVLLERRRRIWSKPLLDRGFAKTAVDRLLARRDRWTLGLEGRGRTPSVPEQVRALARWARVPIAVGDLAAELDAALLRTTVKVAPGGREALSALVDDGLALALVSNVLHESGDAARTVLDRLGLLPRFRAVVLSCEQPWAKPAPEPFLLACSFLGTAPSSAVHVGDLDYDLRGARSAGMGAWWYTGLGRWNRYLRGQVDPRAVGPGGRVGSWTEVVRRVRGTRARRD
jgi:FMN phosphatase YigB (HAD superfamily)